jgi:hypothetical protein
MRRYWAAAFGGRVDVQNIGNDFKLAMYLAFVRMVRPQDKAQTAGVDPLEIAYVLAFKIQRGIDGPKPAEKKHSRATRNTFRRWRVSRKSCGLKSRRVDGASMYYLRHTHITWAP